MLEQSASRAPLNPRMSVVASNPVALFNKAETPIERLKRLIGKLPEPMQQRLNYDNHIEFIASIGSEIACIERWAMLKKALIVAGITTITAGVGAFLGYLTFGVAFYAADVWMLPYEQMAKLGAEAGAIFFAPAGCCIGMCCHRSPTSETEQALRDVESGVRSESLLGIDSDLLTAQEEYRLDRIVNAIRPPKELPELGLDAGRSLQMSPVFAV